jgi:hypothetical protein
VEDPNGWWPGLYFGIVFTHGKNVYRPSRPSRPRHAHLPLSARYATLRTSRSARKASITGAALADVGS